MCDRRAQEEDFRDTFLEALEQHSSAPQIYFVTGEEGQCHESLVERLIDRANRCAANEEVRTGGRVKNIAWQYDGELAQRTSRLIYSLFEHLGPARSGQPLNPKKLSSAAFHELIAGFLKHVHCHPARSARIPLGFDDG
jgi:hypothetical protein